MMSGRNVVFLMINDTRWHPESLTSSGSRSLILVVLDTLDGLDGQLMDGLYVYRKLGQIDGDEERVRFRVYVQRCSHLS